jgi:membrane fusion protein, multidrug efflux system
MAEAVVKKIYPERTETAEAKTAEAKTKSEAPASRPSDIGGLNQKPSTSRRDRLRWILFGLLPIILIAGGIWYALGGAIMSTDDSYVDAEKVGISTDVAGIVQTVEVKENEHVDAGQVLYRLDPRQFQIALDSAKANLAQISLNVDAMRQDYQHMLSDAAGAQGQVDLDQLNFNRQDMLIKTGNTPQATYDQAKYTLAYDKAKLESLQQQAKVQLAKLGGDPNTPTDKLPQYSQAQAQLDEAQRQFDHTVVKAPFAGTATNVPSIAPGKYLAASATAFYLVDNDHVWIAANPKETELTYVRPGQSATITIDSYPDLTWNGVVESVSPAAAQEFSLLPAQNTSGNWVKVVQRVPMRVRVDASDKNKPPLRAGMSAVVNVDTGHRRGFPRFW